MAIPRRLRREPLVEVIWQVLFEEHPLAAPGELLLGILYDHLRKRGGAWQVEALPLAQVPRFLAQQDPVLRHAVTHRLEAAGEPILYQLGGLVLSVNCRRPYVGWERFRESIRDVAELVRRTLPTVPPAAFTLRYLDLVPREYAPDMSAFRISLSVGDERIAQHPLHLRVELPYRGRRHVVQVISPSQVRLPNGAQLEGILVDLETGNENPGSWAGFEEELEELHMASKAMFFEQILSPELLTALEPEY